MKVIGLSCTMLMYLIVYGKKFFVFITKRRIDSMYREGSGRIFKWLNNFLHESLHLLPVMILIILF